MTIKELIEKLNYLPGDMPVKLYTDHGQTLLSPFSVKMIYVHKDELGNYMIEDFHDPEDHDESDDDDYVIHALIDA